MCKVITTKGSICKLSPKKEYCHIHEKKIKKEGPTVNELKNKLYEKEIQNEKLTSKIVKLEIKKNNEKNHIGQINELNKAIEKKNKKNLNLKNTVSDLEKTIKKEQNKRKNMSEKIEMLNSKVETMSKEIEELKKKVVKFEDYHNKYKAIDDFDLFKYKIKEIYPFDPKNFYIYKIKYEKKYHKPLKEKFNMEISDIIDKYYELRNIRNDYCHPHLKYKY